MMKQRGTVLFAAFLIFAIFSFLGFYGCKKDTASLPKQTVKKTVAKTVTSPESSQPDAEPVVQDSSKQEGYIYEQRGRRDPFTSLIIPTAKTDKDNSKIGTLEGYDLGEFALLAIAKKGAQYYALLVTPDNRSFTVDKGTRIGLSNGKVKEITSDKIVLEEFTRDYLGERIPRQILLEFHKGE